MQNSVSFTLHTFFLTILIHAELYLSFYTLKWDIYCIYHLYIYYSWKVWAQQEINTLINKLIKSGSEDIYYVIKCFYTNKCCSFEISIHQKSWKNEKQFPLKYLAAVFNIDNNKTYFLSTNQYIRMISEGSCDTKIAENSALLSSE